MALYTSVVIDDALTTGQTIKPSEDQPNSAAADVTKYLAGGFDAHVFGRTRPTADEHVARLYPETSAYLKNVTFTLGNHNTKTL
jgi:hypothetical protein